MGWGEARPQNALRARPQNALREHSEGKKLDPSLRGGLDFAEVFGGSGEWEKRIASFACRSFHCAIESIPNRVLEGSTGRKQFWGKIRLLREM